MVVFSNLSLCDKLGSVSQILLTNKLAKHSGISIVVSRQSRLNFKKPPKSFSNSIIYEDSRRSRRRPPGHMSHTKKDQRVISGVVHLVVHAACALTKG